MARLKLYEDRDGLSAAQREVFDWVVESRGSIIPPYQVLLHTPGLARPAAELGHQIRYEGSLSDHDRELAILATGTVHQPLVFGRSITELSLSRSDPLTIKNTVRRTWKKCHFDMIG